MRRQENTKDNIIMSESQARALLTMAITGFNAESTYKTCKPFPKERTSERMMRRGEDSELIDKLRELLES